MSKIVSVEAREVLDSRGNPTVQATVRLTSGIVATAMSPSGASTGVHEAVELRDKDPERYASKGVLKAVENVNTKINKALNGISAGDQEKIDETLIKLDGTPNKSKLGANATIAVSMACARATSQFNEEDLYEYLARLYSPKSEFKMPIPLFNILNGGAHADNNISFQEFMIVPNGIPSYPEQLRAGAEINRALEELLIDRGSTTAVGDEGGFAPNLPADTFALELLHKAIEEAGYKPNEEVDIGIDVAASQYFNPQTRTYSIPHMGPFKTVQGPAREVTELYYQIALKFPICIIEDGLAEDDWEGWEKLYETFKDSEVNIIGDDLTVTNPGRAELAIKRNTVDGMIIKPNQVGTLTETLKVTRLCQKSNKKVIVSHRSGETTDTFVADLAVGVGADYLKDGAPVRGERVAKYNRLLEIHDSLSKSRLKTSQGT